MKYIVAMILISLGCSTAYANNGYYYNNVQNVEVIQKRVLFDARYFAGVNGYYSVGERITAEKENAKIDELAKQNAELRAALEAIYKVLSGGQAVPTSPGNTPEPPVPEEPKDDDLTSQIQTLFKTRCYNCHQNDNNGLDMFDDKGKINVSLADAVNVHYRVEGLGFEEGTTIMPKGGKPLDNDEMILVKKWLKSLSDKEKK